MRKSPKNISLVMGTMFLLFSFMNVSIVHCRTLRPFQLNGAGAAMKSGCNQGGNAMQQSTPPPDKASFSAGSSASRNDSSGDTSSFVRGLRYILASGPSRRGAGH